MRIAIAADHRGYKLKEIIKVHLFKRNIEVIDLGTDSEESVDYPIYGISCANHIVAGDADFGILCCGTGIGMSIAANKIKGIRCAVCTDVVTAASAKAHNDANIIALGSITIDSEQAPSIVDAWLDGAFKGGRHKRRVDMLNEL